MSKIIKTGINRRRAPATSNSVMRLGGGFNTAVLDSLSGYEKQTPEQMSERVARLFELQRSFTSSEAVVSPIPTPLYESDIVSDLGAGAMALHRMRTE